MIAIVAGVAAVPATAVTAPPWTSSFGRLVEPVPPLTPGADATAAVPAASPTIGVNAPALDCLAEAIAYEAGNESAAGQAAVAEVVLNRVAHPAFPKTVCGVVFQGAARRTGCQFTFTCDGSRLRPRSARTRATALRIAAAALGGARRPDLAGATHYHANYVSPYWAPSLIRIAAIGAHIFYRFPGGLQPSPSQPSALSEPAKDMPRFAPWGVPTN